MTIDMNFMVAGEAGQGVQLAGFLNPTVAASSITVVLNSLRLRGFKPAGLKTEKEVP